MQVAPGVAEEAVYRARGSREPGVRTYLDGKTVRKRIFVPDKLLNIVVA